MIQEHLEREAILHRSSYFNSNKGLIVLYLINIEFLLSVFNIFTMTLGFRWEQVLHPFEVPMVLSMCNGDISMRVMLVGKTIMNVSLTF